MQELRLFKVGKISIHLYCGSHVGGQKNAHQPIFQYNIIKNSPTSLTYNSAVFVPNNFKFGTKTRYCCRKTAVCIGDQLLDFSVPELVQSQSTLALTQKSFRIAQVSLYAAQQV